MKRSRSKGHRKLFLVIFQHISLDCVHVMGSKDVECLPTNKVFKYHRFETNMNGLKYKGQGQ